MTGDRCLRTRTSAALAAALLSCAFASDVLAEAPSAGAALYAKECSLCHGRLAGPVSAAAATRVSATPETTLAFSPPYGPTLVGIHGRPAGSVPNFDYSKAFLRAMKGVVWDSTSLDEYLTDTQARAPGTRMYYSQPDKEIRRSIIEYLATFEKPR